MDSIRLTCNKKSHLCNPVHYNNTPGKSQWIPQKPEHEYQLFNIADLWDWTDGTSDYWSFERDTNGDPAKLGIDKDRINNSTFAVTQLQQLHLEN